MDRMPRHDGGMNPLDAASVAIGYDPAFLTVPVPLPVALADTETVALAYPHFSVSLDTSRRLAAVTGVNIDGARLHDLERTGDWELDPRVPPSAQTGPAVYAANDFDRGHLVRRRDPGWGTIAEATFVYPNAAPQAAVFNQSEELWVGLENHVLQWADAADLRVSVFTAPVLGADDPPYRGIRVPLRFWKVAAWADDGGELAAAGFILDQSELIDITEGVVGVAPLGGFRTFQVPIADIGELAGIDLGPLVAADVLSETVSVAGSAWVELTDPSLIRL